MLRKLIQTCLMISVALLLLTVQSGDTVAQTQIDYEPFERVLASYVDEHGYVDYAGLKKNPIDLDTFIGQISQISPASHPALFPTREAKLAYWINAYNAWMLRLVVDHYPVKKVTSIGLIPHGVFLWRRIQLGGRKMSLRHLENEIIRKQFGDPRIHFALNCASIGCPRLPQEIFHPERLDEQLEAAAREFNNQDRYVRVEAASGRLVLSKIFDWYAKDFISEENGRSNRKVRKVTIQDYVWRYLSPARRRKLAGMEKVHIVFRDYDWGLNDQAARRNGKNLTSSR